MFDNLLNEGEEKPTGVDVLLKLIENEDSTRISDLEMQQIKIAVIDYWFYQIIELKKSALEAKHNCINFYMKIKASYKRKGREEIVKGVSEMKDALLQAGLIQRGMVDQ